MLSFQLFSLFSLPFRDCEEKKAPRVGRKNMLWWLCWSIFINGEWRRGWETRTELNLKRGASWLQESRGSWGWHERSGDELLRELILIQVVSWGLREVTTWSRIQWCWRLYYKVVSSVKRERVSCELKLNPQDRMCLMTVEIASWGSTWELSCFVLKRFVTNPSLSNAWVAADTLIDDECADFDHLT